MTLPVTKQPESENLPPVEEPLNCNWPRNILEAYARGRGPYTMDNAETLLEEEPLELFNGWLVWQPMTNANERRIANNIQVILDLAARAAGFGQAYPDQFECKLLNGDDIKPDICLLSKQRYAEKVTPTGPGQRMILQGGPEMAVELRSPSNTRPQERRKRRQYFENGTLLVWDVDPERSKIYVYRVEDPAQPTEYKVGDIIDCEPILPGWKRPVADFFSNDLSAEEMVGEVADPWKAQAREEGREEGRVEGREEGQLQALRQVLLLQAQAKFGAELSANLENRLSRYNAIQLTNLATTLATSTTLADWLAAFSD